MMHPREAALPGEFSGFSAICGKLHSETCLLPESVLLFLAFPSLCPSPIRGILFLLPWFFRYLRKTS